MTAAGYSGTPLARKLGFKPGMRAHYAGAPGGFDSLLGVGMLWVAWPKRSSGVASDMTEDAVRDVALPIGLVDVKVIAIDDTW